MYNFKTIEILKCTRGMKEIVLRDLERQLFLALLHALICKTSTLYIEDPQSSISQPRGTSWTQTFTSDISLGISTLTSHRGIILNMFPNSQFLRP